MIECLICGTKNTKNAEYCQECGKKLETVLYKRSSFIGIVGIIWGLMIATPLFLLSLISGIYLYKQPEYVAKQKGKFLIWFPIILFVLMASFKYVLLGTLL